MISKLWHLNINSVNCRMWFETDKIFRYMDVPWASWRLKSPAISPFVIQLVQVNTKKTPKTLHNWPLYGEPPVHNGFPSQSASDVEGVTMSRLHHAMPLEMRKIFRHPLPFSSWRMCLIPWDIPGPAFSPEVCPKSLKTNQLAKKSHVVPNYPRLPM